MKQASSWVARHLSGVVAIAFGAGLLSGCTYASEMIGMEQPGFIGLPAIRVDNEIAELVPAHIRDDGKLTIASELTYAPMEYVGADGKTPEGMDIDIAKAVSAVLGLTPDIKSSSFDAIIPALGTRYEAGFSAFTVTQDRLAAVNMISYLEAGSQLAVQAGNPTNVDPNNLCGVSVAVQIGTVQQEELEALNKGDCAAQPVKIFPYESQADATANLVGGKVQAMSADSPITGYAVAQTGDALTELGEIKDAAPYGIVVAKPDYELAEAITLAIQHLIDTGVMAQIAEHWGNEPMLIEQAQLWQ